MIAQFLSWYLVIQVITLLTLPLAWRLLSFLPDRGYGSARILGILLAGYGLWIALQLWAGAVRGGERLAGGAAVGRDQRGGGVADSAGVA